jgi:hypothetical protein
MKHLKTKKVRSNLESNERHSPQRVESKDPRDPQCLYQRVVDRDAVVMKLLPQRLLGLRLIEVGQRHVIMAQALLRVRDVYVRGGRCSVGC